jgi:ADP-ribosyl-[dinitrogen reductase] hydrolase
MKYDERYVNALKCMAVGDSVGAPFEFASDDVFRPEHIIAHAKGGDLFITDDTQMTLFGFESMLTHTSIQGAYMRWFFTQTQPPPKARSVYTSLIEFPELFVQRDPGTATMNSLKQLFTKGDRKKNESKGCGSVMRILPFIHDDALMNRSISITHDHRDNIVAAMALRHGYNSVGDFPTATHISELGEGWVADECVEMALWAVNNARTFDELLVKSIHHDGDSDSVAAVACSLWGFLGRSYDYYDRVLDKAPIDYIISKM